VLVLVHVINGVEGRATGLIDQKEAYGKTRCGRGRQLQTSIQSHHIRVGYLGRACPGRIAHRRAVVDPAIESRPWE